MEICKDPPPSYQSYSPPKRGGARKETWRGGAPSPQPGGSCPRSPSYIKVRLLSPFAQHNGLPWTICNLADRGAGNGPGQTSKEAAQ